MRTIIFMILLLAHVSNAHATTKALKQAGVDKLNAWAQNVARIYGTALKHMSSTVKAENLDIYVYGKNADGFTAAGSVKVRYDNNNISFTPGCLSGSVNLTAGNPGCFPTYYTFNSKVDYGNYTTESRRDIIFEPENQYRENGTGSCLGQGAVTAVNVVCARGVRKYGYTDNPTLPGKWSALSVSYPDSYANYGTAVCISNANQVQSFSSLSSISCNTNTVITGIKQVIASYRDYLTSCYQGVLPERTNSNLLEVKAVLSEMENGVPLVAGDYDTVGTNPPPAKNPWTFTNPTLATEGLTSQTHLVGNVLPDKFKVRVTNASGVVPVVFSVSPPDGGWAFIPEGGQAVTRDTVNGIAETGFKLGTVSGTYPIKATCAECCPSEVAFTATALTNGQATELRVISCDRTGGTGEILLNPFSVMAFNRVTQQGMPDYETAFSGNNVSIVNSYSITNHVGVSNARVVLGSAQGQGSVTAHCTKCLANTEARCDINIHSATLKSDGSLPAEAIQNSPSVGDFLLNIEFQPQIPHMAPRGKVVLQPEIQYLGVLKGHTVKFTAKQTPLISSPGQEFIWSGEKTATGQPIEVIFNNVGYKSENIAFSGKSSAVTIEVADDPTYFSAAACLATLDAAAACRDAKAMAGEGFRWANSMSRTVGGGRSNGPVDAVRHAYWSALVTVKHGLNIAEAAGTGHEADGVISSGQPDNETVMDLDNNAVGRQIGNMLLIQQQTSDQDVQQAILQAFWGNRLKYLDEGESNRRTLTGLLQNSGQ